MRFSRKPRTPGFDVVGYLRTESGVGEAARLLLAAIEAGGLPHSTFAQVAPALREQHPFTASAARGGHSVVVLAINADELPRVFGELPRDLTRDAYSIAMWQWEVEEFPARMARASAYVNEIWVNSRHEFDAIAPVVDVPVQIFPLPIVGAEVGPDARKVAGFGDRFTFLFCFDAFSVVERKNPLGAVKAFCRAFKPDEGPTLVIKSVNGSAFPDRMAELHAAAGGRRDIEFRDGYVSSDAQHALMASCDAYVSLHRAEGYGLTLAEAMAAGRPVIATGYSGNLEFMTHANSWLVPWDFTPVPEGSGPYPVSSRWADPDLDAAAAMMRCVASDRDAVEERVLRARSDIRSLHTPATSAPFLQRRLHAVSSQPSDRQRRAPRTRATGI